MAEFVKAGKVSEVPNFKMKAFNVEEKQITVANIDGKYFAFEDACTHMHCSLAGGQLKGKTITCYCHGAQFDISTGKVLAPPASLPLKVYNVKIEGENILVEV